MAPAPAPPAKPQTPDPKPQTLISALPEAWKALLAQANQKPSWRWMKALTLARHEDLLAVFSAQELNDEQTRFLLSRRAQLADELSKLTGRTIRIDLQLPGQQGQPTPENPTGILPPQRANVPVSLQDAMTLPLVRQVMNIFNASVMEVHRDESNLPPRPAAAIPDPDADPDAPLDSSDDTMSDLDNE